MTKRYRLLSAAQMHGAVREPGYVFTLGKDKDGNDELGPHRTVVASNHGAQITEHMNEDASAKLKDVPLYEEIEEAEEKPAEGDTKLLEAPKT